MSEPAPTPSVPVRVDVDENLRAAVGADVITILPIVELDIVDDVNTGGSEGPVRTWGGIGPLSWRGQTWLGVGSMGEIGPIQADAKGSVPSLELSLLGLEPEMLAAATNQLFRGRGGRVWLACFDDNMTMQGEPALYFAGEISGMRLVDGPERRIQVTIDSRMAILKKNKPRYRTDEDQQRRQSGDLFFNFTPAVTNKTIYWGLNAPKSPNVSRDIGQVAGPETLSLGNHF